MLISELKVAYSEVQQLRTVHLWPNVAGKKGWKKSCRLYY